MNSPGSSSLVEAQASLNANQLHQTETTTCMDLAFYDAAAEGKIQVFKDPREPLYLLLTPNQNTILHIYITALHDPKPGSITVFVEEILDICPPLLQQRNYKGETPLHIAARYGHVDVVKVLIRRVTTLFKDIESQVDATGEIIRLTNQWKDTALHEAVRYNHLEVVELLLREDPDFEYSANEAGETLLYMDVEREMIKKIIEKDSGLTKQANQMGFTPLHLAAGFNRRGATYELLQHDREMAYMKDMEGRTALHIAAYEGNYFRVKYILSSCPNCCDLVDNRGWSVFHFFIAAPKFSHRHLVELLLENPSLKNLLNEKDLEGNTPFLLHSKTNFPILLKKLIDHSSVDKMAFNNQNLSAVEIAMTNENLPKRKRQRILDATHGLVRRQVSFRGRPNFSHEIEKQEEKLEEKLEEKREGERGKSEIGLYEKMGEYHLVVAALVTTVTFAAGITMPGGFMGQDGPHPGSAILARSTAFQAFIITDAISMLLSILAIFAIMLLPAVGPRYPVHARLATLAYASIVLALYSMALAFVTGTYAVLARHSMGLAVAVCLIGLSFFPIISFAFTGWITTMATK